jgi:L-lactate dehydrogenase (cytochrome)
MGRPCWAWDVGWRGRPHRLGNLEPLLGERSGLNDYMGWLNTNFDPSIFWKDLDWIRAGWDGPLIIKGVLDPEDARAAADIGADGIVVSNHGGRQLDGVLSSARALPAIAEAVGDRLTVLADSGVRSGLDVVRMLALGAKGVLLGRAWIFALAARGEAGVRQMLDLIASEMRVAMTLTGARRIADIGRSSLVR